MDRIKSVAMDSGARRVTKLTVRLGALSQISAEHFSEHFVEAAKGGIAESAELAILMDSDEHCSNAQDIMLESLEIES